MKNMPRNNIILHMCTKNYNPMMYCSLDMMYSEEMDRQIDRQTDGQEK